jgi:hypothetical protein
VTDIRSATLCLVLIPALPLLAGCSGQKAAQQEAAQTSPPLQSSHASAAAPGGSTVTGTVVETMDAASYTYVRLETASGEIWAASSQFKVAVGDRVVVPLEMPMQNFHSQSLNRDFPVIYFASAIVKEGEQPPAAMPPGHPPVGGGAQTSDSVQVIEPIAPPAGGLTIAGVWADRAALVGKTVTVRGKVVRYNGGILDRNWLHIQDGSGSASDGTHDLTVTTSATAKVGDVVTVTGTVAADKDFGAGYAYKVIVVDATLAPR